MAEHSSIEWTEATWNPITGCSVVSAGCKHCYAMKLAGTRFRNHPSRKGLTQDTKAGPVWTGEVRLNEEWLTQPLRWKRPRMIFVCAHGDLFHESVPDEWIDRVFAVMALAPHHTFQVLTKRPERMRAYLNNPAVVRRIYEPVCDAAIDDVADVILIAPGVNPADAPPGVRVFLDQWPLPNVWLGVSVEDQKTANARIPDLLGSPATIRWVSYEPALGPVDFTRICLFPRTPGSIRAGIHINALAGKYVESGLSYIGDWDVCGPCPTDWPALSLDWIVAGGESGSGARPAHPDWFRSTRDQCADAGVPFLFKQWGEWLPVGQVLPGCGKIHGATAVKPGRFKLHYGGTRHEHPWHAFAERGVEISSFDAGPLTFRVGKKRAGRLLHGVEHNGFPEVRS